MKRQAEFSPALLRRCEEFSNGRKLKPFFLIHCNGKWISQPNDSVLPHVNGVFFRIHYEKLCS